MSAGTKYIIPIKFILIIFHLLVVTITIYSPIQNIYAGIPANTPIGESSYYTPAFNETQAVGSINLFFLIIELCILVFGQNLFYDFFNSLQIFIHFIGAFLTTWYIIEGWNYRSLKYIFGVFTIIPMCLEFFPLVIYLVKKSKQM
ncbi:hypothetical protein ABPG74_022789 [Tetrahymena malaccensis]